MRALLRLRQVPQLCCAFPAAAHSLLFAVCRNASIFNLGPQHFAVAFSFSTASFDGGWPPALQSAAMELVQKINSSLASSIAFLNALLAVMLILAAMAASYQIFGLFGIVLGFLLGGSAAVAVCGILAILINIRDLLAASQQQQG